MFHVKQFKKHSHSGFSSISNTIMSLSVRPYHLVSAHNFCLLSKQRKKEPHILETPFNYLIYT